MSNRVKSDNDPGREPVSGWRRTASYLLIVAGLIVGITGFVLLSNRYGNTDTYWLPAAAAAGLLLGTGLSSLTMPFRYAMVIGLASAPLMIALPFVLYALWAILA